MDRKGGGPMVWSDFYGRTAEKFFYHPVDRGTTYHTETILAQKSPKADNRGAAGVPSRQGLPVHQRPPQFDYIYKANQDAKARAEQEASDLSKNIDALLARRPSLEVEQSGLWCEIAFRAVSRQDLARKPLYRFEPMASGDQQKVAAMKAAAIFMRTALSIVAEAQKDQTTAFGNIKVVVTNAREQLDDSWMRQAFLAADMTDLKTSVGKFLALAKRLDDVANNLSDSYQVSIDADRFKDEQRKNTFRALLQESVVGYAEIVLALDEMAALMAAEWKFKPDVDKPIVLTSSDAKANAEVQSAMAKLEQNPTDPEANLAVGKHLCLIEGNWDKGISMLALGSDPALKNLAVKELGEVVDSQAQAALGDGWWELGEKEVGSAKKQLQERAEYWYRQALPGLAGLAKDRVEGRLKAAAAAAATPSTTAGQASLESAVKKESADLPKGWQARFNAGRKHPTYDPKTGVLLLYYDFSNPKQLKDFEVSEGAEPVVSKGVLTLKGAESIKHVVRFKTMKVSAAYFAKGAGKVMATTEGFGVQVTGWGDNILLLMSNKKCAEYSSFRKFKYVRGPVNVQEWFIDSTKTGLIAGPADIRAKNEGRDAGHLVLMAETHPNSFQALTISGVVDQKWATDFFAR